MKQYMDKRNQESIGDLIEIMSAYPGFPIDLDRKNKWLRCNTTMKKAPLRRLERRHLPPEGSALSTELQGHLREHSNVTHSEVQVLIEVFQSSAQDITTFLSMIRFDSSQKLEDLYNFQLDSKYFFDKSVRVALGVFNVDLSPIPS